MDANIKPKLKLLEETTGKGSRPLTWTISTPCLFCFEFWQNHKGINRRSKNRTQSQSIKTKSSFADGHPEKYKGCCHTLYLNNQV